MRFSSIAKSSVLLAPLLVAAASDVIDLTSDNFQSVTSADGLTLVEFFAPWCGHCKALAPHYEESATALKDKNIKLAKVDCVDQADLCSENDIKGYPTLKVYKNGTPTAYNGPRQADGIISYMVKQSLPAVSSVDAEMHETFTSSDKVVVVLYAAESEPITKIFAATAEENREDYLFGQVTDPSLSEEAKVTPPAIVLYKTFDEGRNDYASAEIETLSSQELEDWIDSNAVPLLDEISGDNYATYAESGLPLGYVFLDPSDEDAKEELIEAVTPVAGKYRGKVNFVWIDAVKFVEHGKQLTLSGEHWPAFVIQNVSDGTKYPLEKSTKHFSKEVVDAATIDAFVADFVAGEVSPSLRSQAEPKEQDQPYYQVVGSTFEKVLIEDDSRDIFVQFSASWCGHCKRLLPTWEKLGETYASVKDKLLIAKMDGAENDIPAAAGFSVQGFPTLKFKAAGSKSFIDYEGDRSFDNLVAFINEHAKNDVTLPEGAAEKVAAGGSSSGKPAAAKETAAPVHDEHDEL